MSSVDPVQHAVLAQRVTQIEQQLQQITTQLVAGARHFADLDRQYAELRADLTDTRRATTSAALQAADAVRHMSQRVDRLADTLNALERRMERAAIVITTTLTIIGIIWPLVAPAVQQWLVRTLLSAGGGP
jgi:septal ring factor EnvC (AmiA/AmiB activator)